MHLWTSLVGMIQVEMTSADLYSSLQEINDTGIHIYDCQSVDELTAHFSILRQDHKKLSALVKKRGDRITVLKIHGIYWTAKRAQHRPVLLIGMLLLCLIALYLPTRVLFVQVDGNTVIPTRLILEKAEACGIKFGASRREVRSERIKNALLEAIPELQWVGVNTSGCVATVNVEERTVSDRETETGAPVSSIVAACDGVIRSCTVIRGNALCRVGQAVKEGETLVSGYTDCGIRITATQAEAEIFADTNRSLTAVTPNTFTFRNGILEETKNFSLIIGKKRINLRIGRGLSNSTCAKIYEQYPLTLPGGLVLPVSIVVERWIVYECDDHQIPEEQAQAVLRSFSKAQLLQEMVAGSILAEQLDFEQENGVYRLLGSYSCTEMIGRIHSEEILENYGKAE